MNILGMLAFIIKKKDTENLKRGMVLMEYPVAQHAAEAFYNRLRESFDDRKSITTFGPYSPGQAVAIKRMGIEGIYLGGWAISAKGSTTEDPGAPGFSKLSVEPGS